MATTYDALPKHHTATHDEKLVITASSLGTVFEWYDFYLYGLLAPFISKVFFTGVNETTGFILALAVFGAGFAVRPFGALVFGRIGDLVGRKNTFLVTMGIMGLSTFCIGLIPGYETLGIASPLILVLLRVLQGLALGGEYGGAATFVAEHAPDNRRGLYTSFIQITATFGLFAALLVMIALRSGMGEEMFAAWGWRVPFLLSIVLLAISMWIRMQLSESPVYQRMKDEGTTSKAPISEAFGQWGNLKYVLIALFGAGMGQAVVWYGGQFYAEFYLEKMMKVDGLTAYQLVAVALALGTPFFVFFGWLSDKIGRKYIVLGGCALAALTYMPAFHALADAANPAMTAAVTKSPVTVTANPAECSFQFDPVGKNAFDSTSCDIAKAYLAKNGINYVNVAAPAGTIASVAVGSATLAVPDPAKVTGKDRAAAVKKFGGAVTAALKLAGYPVKDNPAALKDAKAPKLVFYADKKAMGTTRVVAVLFYLVLLVTMVYGPIAALLVELFPSKIRYTSMSLPYHIANGWFGGFLPTTAFAMVAATGDINYGLWYPITVAAATVVIGLLFLPETFRRNIDG